ncbi:hypothetical protein HK101_001394 [Irineochytrium annulatum]|nr:hypothetical protein HK101_001394 [Irineochytrium annulatum]
MAFDLDEWTKLMASVLALRPVSATNPRGVQQASRFIEWMLVDRGFEVHRVGSFDEASGTGSDILIATRPPRNSTMQAGKRRWVLMGGHFDVAEVDEAEVQEWRSDPFLPTVVEGRAYGRGVGDNLGPLIQRLLCITAEDEDSPGLAFLLHGEEETGSHYPHEVYPTLAQSSLLPEKVDLVLEETGYFLRGGALRLLVFHGDSDRPLAQAVIAQVRHFANDELRRDTVTEERYLNKAFGEQGCPFLKHIVPKLGAPYMSVGLNDVGTGIHGPNESVLAENVKAAAQVFRHLLDYLAYA